MTRIKARTLSENAIAYLVKQGFNLAQIGRLLNLERSYISRVSRGERAFTIDHLDRLAKEFDMSTWEFLTASTPPESVPSRLQKGYELLVSGLKTSEKLLDTLKRKATTERRIRHRRTG